MIDGHTFLIHFPVKLYFGVVYYDVPLFRVSVGASPQLYHQFGEERKPICGRGG